MGKVLGSIGFIRFKSTFALHIPQGLGCKDIIHQKSLPENSSCVIT